MPPGGVRLSGGPVLSEGEASMLESDVSSIISISDRYLPSDTEDDDGTHDKAKYRLPDPGKTRLHLRTKEPLSPSARPGPRSPNRRPQPATPRTPQAAQSNPTFQSPIWPAFLTRNGSSESIGGLDGDFATRNLSRTESIYTLGRASLQGQLAHLTSLKLPDPTSLAKKISSIPTSAEAAKALSEAAEQIRIWISKASDVLNSLNAEDDVEWAAAGGKDGIEDVDKATNRFQDLVEVYVDSIDRLQSREDASKLSHDTLKSSVQQMEGIVGSWQKVRDLLKGVKRQVEIAIEWEELWNSLLGEIGQEMDALNRLVFEMEEKRHSGVGGLLSSKDSIDLHELETIVEERPGQGAVLRNHRLSLLGPISGLPPMDQTLAENKEDASLLALFARMQPLRASLDFLPMRLATFRTNGHSIFPSACADLESRRDHLEQLWKKLEADAEALRRELGEDRWVLVFRNAGRQALKMEESISRTFNKLKDAVDGNEHRLNSTSFMRKVESYDAKKAHYGPAIERVLAIIDRGVAERLTVNGEILRLQLDMKERWSSLQAEMHDMDLAIEELDSESIDKQYRDSVSTVMSSERSVTSSLVDTPGSSPASSVVGGASGHGSRTPTPLTLSKQRRTSSRIPSSIPRRIPLTHSGEFNALPSSSPLIMRSTNRVFSRPEPATSSRPRWQTSTKAENRDFLPLSALEPSPYAKSPGEKYANYLRSSSNPADAANGTRTPLSRRTSTPNFSSINTMTPTAAPPVPKIPPSQNTLRKSALPVPTNTQTPTSMRPTLMSRKSHSALRSTSQHSTASQRSAVPPPLPPPRFTDGNDADTEAPAHHKSSRSGSSLSNGRVSSLLVLRMKRVSGAAGEQAALEKPRWRP